MKTLEIIHLRASGQPPESLRDLIRESVGAGGEERAAVKLYRRHGLDTDLTLHIRHPGAAGRGGPSELGLRLASALRAYGLVEHTLWEELR